MGNRNNNKSPVKGGLIATLFMPTIFFFIVTEDIVDN